MAVSNGKQLGARKRRDTDAVMDQFMKSKSLKFDYDDDGDYDEMDRIRQLNVIKMMAVSIEMKRKLRARLFERMPDVSGRSCAAYLHRQRAKLYRFRVRSKRRFNEAKEALTLWSGAFKKIEGHFGSGVVSYFTFLKHLFLTNLLLAIIVILFVTIPMALFPETQYNDVLVGSDVSTSEAVSLAVNCSQQYTVTSSEKWYEYIINVLQGTGFMEKTVLFYGYYADKELDFTDASYNYNMPFAYVTSINIVFVISLAIMVVLSAKGFKERLLSESQNIKRYFNKIFLAWDYSLNDEKTSDIQHKSIYRDIAGSLEHDRDDWRRKTRTRNESCKIWTIRILLNVIVMAMLGGSGYLIYYTTVKTIELTQSDAWSSYHLILQFLVQYMTSLTITILNILVPIVFKKLVTFEDYSVDFTVNITLVRTVFLRLASLAVVLFSLYVSIACSTKDYCNVGTDQCTSIVCWETYAGQELYKLVMMDFIVAFLIILLLEFPRRLVVTKCPCKLSQIIGLQEFDISKNVLDLVYTETLMWLGVLFCPLLPAITVVKNFIIFYLKMLTTLKNYTPSANAHHASDSEHFFQILLLTSFFGCVIPVLYVMWQMVPSRGCGPYRVYGHMIDVVSNTINTWPSVLRSIISFITSSGVVIGLLIILILVIHYLAVSNKAYKDMVKMMQIHLQLESQDKQFLLTQVAHSGDNKQTSTKKRVTGDVEAQRSSRVTTTLPGEITTTANDENW